MKGNQKKGAILCIAIFVFALNFIAVQNVSCAAHAPIVITGNGQFTGANGVSSGIGTPGDPYIIENYEIDATTATGINITSTDKYFVIRNCNVHNGGSNYDGIYLENVTHGIIDNCTVYDNSVGIVLWSSSNNTLTGNTAYNNRDGIDLIYCSNNILTGNTAYNHTDCGFFLWGNGNNTLTGNTAYNNDGTGITIRSNNNILTANTFYNNGYDGIRAYTCNNNILTGNIVYNNADNGILLYDRCNNNTLTGNTAYNNTRGIRLVINANNNNLTCNTVHNNSYGIYLAGSSGTEIHYCDIYSNTQYGVYNNDSDPSYIADATLCYWGSADGPDGAGTGTGDTVNVNVLYEPWLSAVMQNATLTIQSSASNVTAGSIVTISGLLSPAQAGNVTIFRAINNSAFVSIGVAVLTNGIYSFQTLLTDPGTYNFNAYWAGNENYDASTSGTITVTATAPLGIDLFWYVIVAGVVIVAIAAAVYFMRRR